MALTVKPLDKVRDSVTLNGSNDNQKDLVRVNIQVEKEIRIKWHTAAMKRDMSLKDLIQASVEAYIK
ncbi:hypothetical protein ACF8PL_00020 [Delftia sp. WSY_4]|jgi:hypothetical protein|uniref:hypothetical protein n=1 Tax=unclassified Delftia TaxID=2613839 RepID=UPI003709FF13